MSSSEGFGIAEITNSVSRKIRREEKLGFKNGAEILKRIILEAQF